MKIRIFVYSSCVAIVLSLICVFVLKRPPQTAVTSTVKPITMHESKKTKPIETALERPRTSVSQKQGLNEVDFVRLLDDWDQETNVALRRVKLSEICRMFVEHSLEEGKKWLISLPNAPASSDAFERFAAWYNIADRAGALGFFGALPKNSNAYHYLRGLASNEASKNFANLSEDIARCMQFFPDRIDDFKLASIRSMRHNSDVQGFFDLGIGIANEGNRKQAITAIAETANPQQAANSFAASKIGQEMPEAYTALLNHWMMADSLKASEWLRDQPTSPAKDAGIKAVVKNLAHEFPEDAFRWIESISNPEERFSQGSMLISRYSTVDRDKAIALIQSSTVFSEADKKKIGFALKF